MEFSNPVADPTAIDAERLFERFYQADVSRATQGSGLGLAVAAELAAAQGMAFSARVEGASLVITLTAKRLNCGYSPLESAALSA